jgi:hypothetical protein
VGSKQSFWGWELDVPTIEEACTGTDIGVTVKENLPHNSVQ